MIKSNGPSIEPWGTPVVIGSCPDFTPFIYTYCVLFVKDHIGNKCTLVCFNVPSLVRLHACSLLVCHVFL